MSESLAGRLRLARMSRLILPELPTGRMDEVWLYRGYPDGGILGPEMFPE
jgi:hypothetical protein